MKMLDAFAERKSYKLVMKNASLDRPQTIKKKLGQPDKEDVGADDNLARTRSLAYELRLRLWL